MVLVFLKIIFYYFFFFFFSIEATVMNTHINVYEDSIVSNSRAEKTLS